MKRLLALWRNRHLQPKTALSRFPPVHRVDLEGKQRVDLTRSPTRRRMAGICAQRTAGVDVERSLRIAAVDVAVEGIPIVRGEHRSLCSLTIALGSPGTRRLVALSVQRIRFASAASRSCAASSSFDRVAASQARSSVSRCRSAASMRSTSAG